MKTRHKRTRPKWLSEKSENNLYVERRKDGTISNWVDRQRSMAQRRRRKREGE